MEVMSDVQSARVLCHWVDLSFLKLFVNLHSELAVIKAAFTASHKLLKDVQVLSLGFVIS